MKKVIVFNGVAKSGKDTLADYLKEEALKSGHLMTTISTVDKVKEISKMFGTVLSDKSDKNRKLWSDIKDMWTEYNNGPFRHVVGLIEKKEEYTGIRGFGAPSKPRLFVVMSREPEDIQKFKDYFGDECMTVIVRRKGIPIPNNHADQNVENFDYDIGVDNNEGLLELKKSAATLFEEMVK